MPRPQSRTRTAERTRTVRTLLLAASALLPISTNSLLAQNLELRGEVSESAMILSDQQAKTQEMTQAQAAQSGTAAGGLPTPIYRPLSQSAAGDDDDTTISTGSIFGAQPATNTFAEDLVPLPRRRPPTTASGTAPAAGAENATSPSEGEAEEDTATNRRASTIDAEDDLPLDPRVERTGAIETLARLPEADPFAPTGIRVGSFTLRPSVEQGITATSNADASNGGRPAALSETTLRLNAISDWSTNSASIDGYVLLRKTLSGEEVEDARGRLDATLNIDLGNEWSAVGKLGYEAAPESASSPVVIVGTASQPLRQNIDGSLGIEKNVGKARIGLTGAVERDIYGDAKLSMGGLLSQKDRNSTLYTATLRTGYEISPALTPFVEIETGRRLYDERVDTGGFERSATRIGGRGGLELDLGEKLAGEFSAGWLRESFDDDGLAPISAATVNADLRWSPERGTTIGLRGTTAVEGTTTAGEGGSVLYSGRLSGERQIRANLTGTAQLGLDWRDYSGSSGHDLIFSAEAGLTWWLNRYAGITTRARHETLSSNLPGRDAKTNSIYVGLTLRR
ncbi:hypothetical protein ASD64_05700 [Mesorhizobium sp. Root157]|uniref:outer membrane beta-barrel protein n=1 Tax=Mesorhizobium sp. Root157 TaxID=1736477 RepID=UPI0006FD24BF|nr:outer membrane beta-barrel protein [Mesorhizobium sp. Root157]KQZ86957.1 hypothetical protein ASD64_05700 [Mesorhizobium sp. Root157]